MSAEPGFVVLSALMRVVVSVRTSFLRVIFLAYIISCMEQKKTLAFILTFIGISFLIVGVTYAVQSFFRESLSAGVSGKAGTVSAAGIVRKNADG